MKSKTLSRILGYEGVALIAFGLLSLVFAGQNYLLAIAVLGAGLLCILGFLVTGGVSVFERIKSQKAYYGANAVYYSITILGLVIAVNTLAYFHNQEWDLTSNKANTLAPQTIQVLESLDKPVKVFTFIKGYEETYVADLLERYSRASDLFEYEFADPELNPSLVEQYNISARGQSAVICEGQQVIIDAPNEQELTTALLKVTKKKQGVIYFLEGHDEKQLEDQTERGLYLAKLGLEHSNYDVRRLLLESKPKVPDDCIALIVAGPTRQISQDVINKIKVYLQNGGRALLMIDPATDSNIEMLAAGFGVKVQNAVVLDPSNRLDMSDSAGMIPIVVDFKSHEITDKIDHFALFPLARPISIESSGDFSISAQPLFQTSQSGWGETQVEAILTSQEIGLDENDLTGPQVLGAAVTKTLGEPGSESKGESEMETRLVIVGDSDFATNIFIRNLFNEPLFLNMVHWLTGEEYLIAIPPKAYSPDMVNLTPKHNQLVFLLSVFLVPQFVFMLGIAAVLKRQGK